MTDDAVDRAIAELLDSEPSADFVARVRIRTQREPSPGVWFAPCWVALGAAAAFIIAIGAIWANQDEVTQPQVSSLAQTTDVAATSRVEPSKEGLRAPRAVSPPASAPVEVLISPAEAEGLRYLMSALRDVRFDPDALPAAGEEIDPPMPLVIEPITVEPLVSAGDIDSGVLQ